MNQHPHLVFPAPTISERPKGRSRHIKTDAEKLELQVQHASDSLGRLLDQFRSGRATLGQEPPPGLSEQMLVFELAGETGQFEKALHCLSGVRPLTHLFQRRDEAEHGDSPTTSVYVAMTDNTALRALQRAWEVFPGQSLPEELAPLATLLRGCRNVRAYSHLDWLEESGALEDWRERIDRSEDRVPFELELAWGDTEADRAEALGEARCRIEELGGQLIGDGVVLAPTQYHGVLGWLPGNQVNSVLAGQVEASRLFPQSVAFYHAVGQHVSSAEVAAAPSSGAVAPLSADVPLGEATVALLDGLPLANHELLAGRLDIDGAEQWEDGYLASLRVHGTAMASVVLHGDLGAPLAPLPRKLHVRPILRPRCNGEATPADELIVDLVHRAVLELPPQVRIVNLSVGLKYQPFHGRTSALAKLLDWLAWSRRLLFVVSAGNVEQELRAPQSTTPSTQELDRLALDAMMGSHRGRRLLAPAEAINALTVGALNTDASDPLAASTRPIVPDSTDVPALYSRFGPGYRRSVKPEILAPGGRQRVLASSAVWRPALSSHQAPGIRVAAPSDTGDLTKTVYDRGTSHAAARVSRLCADLLELVRSLADDESAPWSEDERLELPLVKALAVHTANWSTDSANRFAAWPHARRQKRERTGWALGYGGVRPRYAVFSTDQRVTLLGGSVFTSKDERHTFSLPMPPALASKAVWRRLTLTAAWLSPTSPGSAEYQTARIAIGKPEGDGAGLVKDSSKQAESAAARRGTVQHEVYEGAHTFPFIDGDSLAVVVDCLDFPKRACRTGLPYGLACSLEVREDSGIAVYEQIRQRLEQQVRAAVRTP